MAATALTVDQAKRSGTVPTSQTSDETNGNKIAITGDEVLRIKNNGASSRTVTFANVKLSNYGYDNDETVTIAAGATKYAGPFKLDRWADSNGYLNLSYSAGTSTDLSIEVVKLGINLSEADTK